MMRFCPNCGTEVDESVLFCPTCGQAIDQAAETAMPDAPAWPDPEPSPEPPPTLPAAAPEPSWRGEPPADRQDAPEPWDPDVADAAPAAEPPASPPPPPPPEPRTTDDGAGAAPRPDDAGVGARQPTNVPLTLPVTLSGWLIGGGALVGALGALIGLVDGAASLIELIMLLALLAVAATIFLATQLPAVPHLRLATLVVALIGFGAAFDRIGFAGAGIGVLLLFLGTAAAAIGSILLELGRDEPLGRG